MEEKRVGIRGTVYQFLLYPDNDSHMKALDTIKSCYEYAYILHDKDVSDEGEVKKVHIHCIVKLPKPKTLHSLCNDVGLEDRFCQKVNNEKYALRYLIHKDNKDKYQYSENDILSNMNYLVIEKYINNDIPIEEKALIIIDIMEHATNFKDLVIMCCNNAVYDELRRMGSLGIQMFREINEKRGQNK